MAGESGKFRAGRLESVCINDSLCCVASFAPQFERKRGRKKNRSREREQDETMLSDRQRRAETDG